MENISKNSQLPRVSVIVVNYNGYHWFKLFLESLTKTIYPDFEIIVVDNASTDQSVQYLKEKFGNIQVVELNENKGYAQAANMGAKHATGAILAFVNNDMEFQSDWLNNAVKKLLSHTETAAVQCKILTYSDRKKIDSIGLSVDRYNLSFTIGRHEIDEGQYDDLQEIGACSGGAMVIWKRIFQEVGAFDPTYFLYYEDVDLSWRIKMQGFRILSAHTSVVYHVGSATIKIMNSSNDGRLSPFLAFHVTKNYIYCWLKNSRLKVIFIYWPVIFFIVLARISFEIVNGRTSVALSQTKGILWNMMHLKYIARERAQVKKQKKVQSDNIMLTTERKDSSHLLTWIRFSRRIVKLRSNSC